jgi:hypothetical protein
MAVTPQPGLAPPPAPPAHKGKRRGKKQRAAKPTPPAKQSSPVLDALFGKPAPGERRSLFGVKFGSPAPPAAQQDPAADPRSQDDDSSHLAA